MPESKLVLNNDDDSHMFSCPDNGDMHPILCVPKRKLGYIEERLTLRAQQHIEKKQRINQVMSNLDFGDDTAKCQACSEGGGKNAVVTRVMKNFICADYSLPAIKLSLTKPELSKTELRSFHRPRGKFKVNKRLQFLPPPPGAAKLPPQEERVMVSKIEKSSELYSTAGGNLIIIEYTEQKPPVLSNSGMASRIIHYWRSPEVALQDWVYR